MTITTADELIKGILAAGPPVFVSKGVSPNRTFLKMYSAWRVPGVPSAGSLTAGVMYDGTSGPVEGQIPFRYPSDGIKKCYLARALFGGTQTGQTTLLVDRIYSHNVAFNATTLTAISHGAFPPRDDIASSDGIGYLVGAEVHTAVGGAAPTITVGYTNSDGVAGRIGTNLHPTVNSALIGSFYPISLQGADKGVRALNTVQLSTSWLQGGFALVVYRVLATFPAGSSGGPSEVNMVTGGMPELHQGTVPFLLDMGIGGAANTITGFIQYAHG
jgi:hypothetical protein